MLTIVIGTIYMRKGDWCASGNRSSQLANLTSVYSLLYGTVYSTVHIALYSEVISKE